MQKKASKCPAAAGSGKRKYRWNSAHTTEQRAMCSMLSSGAPHPNLLQPLVRKRLLAHHPLHIMRTYAARIGGRRLVKRIFGAVET